MFSELDFFALDSLVKILGRSHHPTRSAVLLATLDRLHDGVHFFEHSARICRLQPVGTLA